jgi:hypothetical protein
MERGYYWVKLNGEWTIAELWDSDPNMWFVCGNEMDYSDSEFDEIGERVNHG